MIDYIQIWVTDLCEIQRLWNHPLIHFKNKIEKVSKETGEFYNKETKEFEGISFRKEPHKPNKPNEGRERIVIGFNPHYWFNKNEHNANNFSALDSIETFKRFVSIFNIESYSNYSANNLEYGLNFLFNDYDKEVIGYNIYHSRNLFIQDQEHRYAKRAHSYYKGKPNYFSYVKLYSKGFQYPEYCDKKTLRFEMGSKQSKNIKTLGIKNIGDLLNIEVYYKLKEALIKNSLKVLIIDQYPKLNELNPRDKNRLIKYSNSSFWYNVIQTKRSATFNEKCESYNVLLDRTGLNINTEFHNRIKEKLEILLPEKRKNSTLPTKSEKRKNSTLDKGRMLTVFNSRICPVTGVNISMQKQTSLLLSNTGLRHLEKTDPIKFNELKFILLTGKPNKYENTVYDQLSKQIRNRHYNSQPIDNQMLLFTVSKINTRQF
ncbi:hypothetical protein SAMN04488007_3666 [Maribacter aquivivus]|uniref:Uncharacterized protein n=1 Tax=Maribacter aquivivus TaxID=228958 RepID=A0A1M6USN8_9FLAO|nr:hypothetical protein [Maribacter aquivivus]SHK72209.1 hypothetical protein SAMN04488007_3666 [Maribacter aquivivus]